MKKGMVVFCVTFLVTTGAYAAGCPVSHEDVDYQEKVTQLIETASSCENASQIAVSCAWGSNIDLIFVQEAQQKCVSRINAHTSVKALVSSSNQLCEKKFSGISGSLANSSRAFCFLDVSRFFDKLLSPAEL